MFIFSFFPGLPTIAICNILAKFWLLLNELKTWIFLLLYLRHAEKEGFFPSRTESLGCLGANSNKTAGNVFMLSLCAGVSC